MRELFQIVISVICIFQDDNATRDLSEQLDALKAHLDYVQDNITEAQTEIADLEVSGNTKDKPWQYSIPSIWPILNFS